MLQATDSQRHNWMHLEVIYELDKQFFVSRDSRAAQALDEKILKTLIVNLRNASPSVDVFELFPL